MSVLRTTPDDSATARMKAARRQTERKNEEAIYLLGHLAMTYPGSHLCESKRYVSRGADKGWRYVLCIHTPLGHLSWHLPDEESDRLAAFLPTLPNDSDRMTRDAKLALLDLTMRDRAHALRNTT